MAWQIQDAKARLSQVLTGAAEWAASYGSPSRVGGAGFAAGIDGSRRGSEEPE